MLIIEIALGIVLAVVVLMYLPQIFSFGIWAAILALGLALGLALVAGVISLAVDYVTVTMLMAALVIGGIFLVIRDQSSAVNLAEEKKRRQSLGYDE